MQSNTLELIEKGAPVVTATRLIRKMSGSAQAHLLEGDDGLFYVVKFVNNPQHRRILVNEWMGSVFLRHLGINTPRTTVIRVGQEFLDANREVCFQLGSRRGEPEPGEHFGSAYPGNPGRSAVYDFVPDALFDRVANRQDFLGALAFDKWTGNSDARQSIFFRTGAKDVTAGGVSQTTKREFVAQMMDNGGAFGGSQWSFGDSPLLGLHVQPCVYKTVHSIDDFEPWLDLILHFPEDLVHEACKQIPARWLQGDDDALEQLMQRLMRRRNRVADLLMESRSGTLDIFPNWR